MNLYRKETAGIEKIMKMSSKNKEKKTKLDHGT